MQDIRWTGDAGAPAIYRSSDFSSRAFCARCGSTIGAIDDAPVIALLTGAFDKPKSKALMPVADSYKSCRPNWWQPQVTRDR
jgi:hypothetical protein